MRQVLSSHYRFIPGSVAGTRRAWRGFSRDLRDVRVRAVSFVPAAGGCFLVVQAEPQSRWLEALRLGPSVLRNQPEAILERFTQQLQGP
jgi:hypothetical protein